MVVAVLLCSEVRAGRGGRWSQENESNGELMVGCTAAAVQYQEVMGEDLSFLPFLPLALVRARPKRRGKRVTSTGP